MIKVLLVEDDPDLRESVKLLLDLYGFGVVEAPDFAAAVRLMEAGEFDVVILDLRLPDENGLKLFDLFPEKLASRTIIVTANATIPGVVDAIKKGAFNYLEKPYDEELLVAQIRKIVGMNRLQEENRSLKNEMGENFTFERVICHSPGMKEAIQRARVLAETDNIILIQGETGTGKEVLSRAIHNVSPRQNEIFLPVNCAAIPQDLFESELFGFEKGAFTGAVSSYSGRFAQADNGTLFLDEIGELPIHIQSKLLRILEDQVVYRLKSSDPLQVDVRLLAATNKDLEDEIKLKQFRGDLYYRLMEASIRIPPLRERLEDILPLVRHFIGVFNHLYNKEVKGISREAEEFFLNYRWPGNIRELKNTIKSIIPFKRNDIIEMNDLSHSILGGKQIEDKKFVSLDEYQKKYIYQVLKVTGFNISRASEILEISRPRLYRKIKSYQLEALVTDEN